MRKITIGNHKGGVGKTALVFNLAATLQQRLRVLAVDTDPQASLSYVCKVPIHHPTLADVWGSAGDGIAPQGAIFTTPYFDLLPASLTLAVAEFSLFGAYGRERLLANTLAQLAPKYDICLIDTPPALGLYGLNALTAADGVIIATAPETLAVAGVRLFAQTIAQTRKRLNPTLTILGLIVNAYDGRIAQHRESLNALQTAPIPTLATIPRSAAIADSLANGVPLDKYQPSHKANPIFSTLAQNL